jgi:UDP-N-acetylglucosamine--N-acetylmuramyl-(pentapeptide) pyrophosphoryl-undecaprenol N-acetylglucosamine transferase
VSQLVVIACGGTGGHLSPGIALAERLRAGGGEVLLLASRKKVDARLLEKYPHLPFERAPGAALVASPAGLLRFAWNLAAAVLFAARLVARRRPAVLVGFGGFMTLAPALVCRLAGIPVVLHEANRVPGKAVRALSKIASRTWLPAGAEIAGLPAERAGRAGFPTRSEFAPAARDAARRALGFPEAGRLLLVVGGSQGARPLNDWLLANLDALLRGGTHVLGVLGGGAEGVERADATNGAQAKLIPFCDRMADALNAADLVVSRAGAGAVAECAACGAPAVLVPFPQAADNHQEANARHAAAAGGAVVVAQGDPRRLTAEVERLIGDDAALAAMRAGMLRLREECPWEHFADGVAALAARRR